jgi:hypothetical protein
MSKLPRPPAQTLRLLAAILLGVALASLPLLHYRGGSHHAARDRQTHDHHVHDGAAAATVDQ